MKMSFQEVQETCNDFIKFLDAKGIDWIAFNVIASMDEEIELTVEEAREHGIIKSDKCCSGGPQWGHAWDCPKQIG